MTKIRKRVFMVGALLALGAALSAQSAESDFEFDDEGTITKYVGWDSVVTIPATIGGKAVTAIGKSAFAKQNNLTGVTIPDSVTSIGDRAFSENKLTSVTIPDSVTSIGGNAFWKNKLTRVTFGKGLVSIGWGAFSDNNLTSVTLPDTIKSIDGWAFSHNVLENVTIPGTNTYIGVFAFARNKKLTSVTLGSLFAFNNASYNTNAAKGSFTSFIEEDNESDSRDRDTNDIGERGKNLFWDYVCNDRKAGTYALDLKYRAPKKDGDFAYVATKYGAVLTGYSGAASAIAIPEKAGGLAVKHLHGTFEGKTVARVRIPNSVTSIGDGAFYNTKLTSVDIPDSVTYIGTKVFSKNNLTSVVIPDSVTYIGAEAFDSNKLTSVVIGNSVTSIGDSAFSGNQLTSVVIPDGVTYIGTKAFDSNKLTSVVIGNSVTYIGAEAFDSNNLTSVVIPDSVTYIGTKAFDSNKLTSVVIGKSVTYIGASAFGNNQLTSVTLPANVKLENYAIPCKEAYDNNGKKAGTYTLNNRQWSYRE